MLEIPDPLAAEREPPRLLPNGKPYADYVQRRMDRHFAAGQDRMSAREFGHALSDPPKILVVGPGRCGKDTVCKWFGRHTRLVDGGGTSTYHAAEIAEALGYLDLGLDRDFAVRMAYAERGIKRQEWRDWLDEYRKGRESILVREGFQRGDVINGCRALEEIDAVIEEGVADVILWIDNPSYPAGSDKTLAYGPEKATDILKNEGSLDDLYTNLKEFCRNNGIDVLPGRLDYD